jgi:hypothetical protein
MTKIVLPAASVKPGGFSSNFVWLICALFRCLARDLFEDAEVVSRSRRPIPDSPRYLPKPWLLDPLSEESRDSLIPKLLAIRFRVGLPFLSSFFFFFRFG